MKTSIKIVSLFCLLLISSCDFGSESDNYAQTIGHIDSARARILFASISNFFDEPGLLRGFDAAGLVVTPLIYDTRGSQVNESTFWLNGLYDLNDDYYIVLSSHTNAQYDSFYLIDKQSGHTVFTKQVEGFFNLYDSIGRGKRRAVQGNNPYYLYESYSNRIMKLTVNGSATSLEPISLYPHPSATSWPWIQGISPMSIKVLTMSLK
ncbi:MAG: hypothetical protein PQJ58_11980 [Spirochaetales bacterium]|nr:hypothetical protein [Spirochaetales bacterium]